MAEKLCCIYNKKNDSQSDCYVQGYCVDYDPRVKGKQSEKRFCSYTDGVQENKCTQNSLNTTVITERCRIAFEGRGATVNIEGHAIRHRSYNARI